MSRITLAQFASANAGNYQTSFDLKAVKSGSDIAFRVQAAFNSQTYDLCDDAGKVKTFRDADEFIKQAGAVGMLASNIFGGITFSGLDLVQPKEFTGDIVKKNQAIVAGYQKRSTAAAERLVAVVREIQLMNSDPTVPQRLKDEKQEQRYAIDQLKTWLDAEIVRINHILGV